MKKSILLIFLLFENYAIAQTNIQFLKEKFFNSGDQKLGGECVLISSMLSVEGEISMKTFEIELPIDGEYFLSAWVMNTSIIKKNNGLKLYIDEQKTHAGNLNPQKEGWQSSKLLTNGNSKTAKLSLGAGKHFLTFYSSIPEVPPVDFIKLTKEESNVEFSDERWMNYFEAAKKKLLVPEDFDLINDSLKNQNLMRVLPNPRGTYDHQVDITFTYTSFFYLYLNPGTTVFETKRPDPYGSNPVMHLFNMQDPVNKGSWGK
ncbi:MAG: hypothetical protein JXA06_01120 [Bacteroidetes bacterium]|nr:hypothetical protein [Bacteroidota bacterium]